MRILAFILTLSLSPLMGLSQTAIQNQTRDNMLHLTTGVAIGSLSYIAIKQITGDENTAVLGSIALGVLAGFGKEGFDKSQGRIFKWEEVGYTSFGAISAVFTIEGIVNIFKHKPKKRLARIDRRKAKKAPK